MPIPYLGSKRKSAGKIYSTIRNLEPNADTLADLFCGGFAISEYFLKKGWSVIANDKNKHVVALLRQTIFEGLNEDKVTEFVGREKFVDVLKKPEDYEDWYVGYVQCVWSFGNNQAGYLFGKDVEPIKKAGHDLVIHRDGTQLKKLIPNLPTKYIDQIARMDNWHRRRIALGRASKKIKTRVLELERLEQLERLERLQQLEQLERLERLQLFDIDYRGVKVPPNAVIYCDIPYREVAEYKEGSFNHDEFWEWARTRTNPVYVSEYNAPDDFKAVLVFEQNSTYAGGNNKGQPKEKLFRLKHE